MPNSKDGHTGWAQVRGDSGPQTKTECLCVYIFECVRVCISMRRDQCTSTKLNYFAYTSMIM